MHFRQISGLVVAIVGIILIIFGVYSMKHASAPMAAAQTTQQMPTQNYNGGCRSNPCKPCNPCEERRNHLRHEQANQNNMTSNTMNQMQHSRPGMWSLIIGIILLIVGGAMALIGKTVHKRKSR